MFELLDYQTRKSMCEQALECGQISSTMSVSRELRPKKMCRNHEHGSIVPHRVLQADNSTNCGTIDEQSVVVKTLSSGAGTVAIGWH